MAQPRQNNQNQHLHLIKEKQKEREREKGSAQDGLEGVQAFLGSGADAELLEGGHIVHFAILHHITPHHTSRDNVMREGEGEGAGEGEKKGEGP